MDVFQPVAAEHCEDRVSLVYNQPPSSSAAAVTAPGRLRSLTDHIAPASVVRDLGIYIDSDVSMRSHVVRTASSCFAVLRQPRTIRR